VEDAYYAQQELIELQQQTLTRLNQMGRQAEAAPKPPRIWGDRESSVCANCRRTISRPSPSSTYDYAHYCRGQCYRCSGPLS
jgi:hypothetical protein